MLKSPRIAKLVLCRCGRIALENVIMAVVIQVKGQEYNMAAEGKE